MGDGRAPRVLPVLLLVLAFAVVVAAAAVDVVAQPTASTPTEPEPVEPPETGTLYCPVAAGEDEGATLAVAPAVDAPTTVTVQRFRGGAVERDEPVELAPGEQHARTLEGDAARSAMAVTWEGGPAVATWVDGAERAAAPCADGAAPEWHVAGFDTTAQNASTLHLFNPFAVDAVVRVTFGTPAGRVALVRTDNVLVPARATVRLNLNEFEPEQRDLAATVTVLAGRVVAQGELRMRPTEHQPGPTGRAVLPAAAEPSTTWTFGYARYDEQAESWIAIHNPTDRDAALEVRVSAPVGDAEGLLREYTAPAGGVVRIDLGDLSEQDQFGVALSSVNDVPVVATRVLWIDDDGGEDVAASLGAAAGSQWALAGGRADGRTLRLALYNPGGEPAVAEVDAGAASPPAPVEVGPNAHVVIDLEGGASAPVRISSDEPIAPDLLLLRPGDPPGLWTASPTAASSWEGPGWAPPTRRDRTLTTTPVAPVRGEP